MSARYQETALDEGSYRRAGRASLNPLPAPAGSRPPREVVLRQRRRRRRTIIGLTVAIMTVNLVLGGGYAYFRWRLGQIQRVRVLGLAEDQPGEVMNVLVVGSDSRDRLSGEAADQAGKDEVAGERSDTIMILHVDPKQQRAAILSVPRDLYVPIADTGTSDRVNAAFALGGAERLASTVQRSLGISVNHFVEVDFVGFEEIVDAVGGVTVFVPNSARDAYSGLDLPRAGCVSLDGAQALAWVRSRHYEYLTDGRWREDPRGDLGRIQRQQDFLRRVMKKAVGTGLTNPFALNRLIGIGVRNLTIDATMSTSDITALARRFRTVDPDTVETVVLPTAPDTVGGKDVLVVKYPEAQGAIDTLNGKRPTPSPAAESSGPSTPATLAAEPAPSSTAPAPVPSDAVPMRSCQ